MRIANLSGRLVVVTGDAGHEIAYDVEKNGSGLFGPDPQASYETWGTFTAWAARARLEDGVPVLVTDLGPPTPAPHYGKKHLRKGVRGDARDAARLAPAAGRAQVGLREPPTSRAAVRGSCDP
jgi:hypothetical protein